jgi:hypothetical protein
MSASPGVTVQSSMPHSMPAHADPRRHRSHTQAKKARRLGPLGGFLHGLVRDALPPPVLAPASQAHEEGLGVDATAAIIALAPDARLAVGLAPEGWSVLGTCSGCQREEEWAQQFWWDGEVPRFLG